MLGWALATCVKGMKSRLRKNWLSILAEREVPQHRNCLWCDELFINYDGYGLCCVWSGLCNQECMNEWACITFCNQARHLGVVGGQSPPMVFGLFGFFFCLSAQSLTVIMIIPLPHYGNNFSTQKKKKMCREKCVGAPPPPPPSPLSTIFRAGAVLSETFCQDCGSVVSITYLVWCVAGCSWWGDGTCCGIGWRWM